MRSLHCIKIKKGRSERYLKDNAALESYLFELASKNLVIEAENGKVFEGEELQELFKKVKRYHDYTDVIAIHFFRGLGCVVQ